MGTIGSYLRSNNNNDPDPLTGLTCKEKYLVQSSFNSLKKDLSNVAINLFLIFLKKYPEEQQQFPPFKDVPYDELKNNTKFKSHAVTVIYSVESMIDNLNNNDILIGLIHKIAEKHYQRNIQAKSFSHLAEAFVELLTPVVSADTMKCWKKTLDVVFNAIMTEIAALQDQQAEQEPGQ